MFVVDFDVWYGFDCVMFVELFVWDVDMFDMWM